MGIRSASLGYGEDSTRQKFTGKERDNETGLDFFGARYFASTQGRFTTTDPLLSTGFPGSPQTWNRYSYVLNNPLRYTDPTGMFIIDPSLSPEEREKILNGYKKLNEALSKYDSKSKDYKRIKRSLDALGKPGVDNGVTVTIGPTDERNPDRTTPTGVGKKTKDNPTGLKITITLNENTFSKFSETDVAGNLGHEGIHASDFQRLAGRGIYNFRDNFGNDEAFRSEIEAYHLSGAVSRVLTPGVANSRSGHIYVPGQKYGLPGSRLYLWNPAWANIDNAQIETLRGRAIENFLTTPRDWGGAGLTKPKK